MSKRQGRKARSTAEVARKVDYKTLRNPFPPLNAFPEDRIDAIHDAALDVLARLGIKVLLPIRDVRDGVVQSSGPPRIIASHDDMGKGVIFLIRVGACGRTW